MRGDDDVHAVQGNAVRVRQGCEGEAVDGVGLGIVDRDVITARDARDVVSVQGRCPAHTARWRRTGEIQQPRRGMQHDLCAWPSDETETETGAYSRRPAAPGW